MPVSGASAQNEIIAAICAAALLLLTALTALFYEIRHQHIIRVRKAKLRLSSANVRIYIYDMASDTITYFDKNSIKSKYVTTSAAFFGSFPDVRDARRLRNWLSAYIEGNGEASSFLTGKVRISSLKRDCLSIYKITNYNAKKRIIHFENMLLPEISDNYSRHSKIGFIKKMSEIEAAAAGKKKRDFACFYFLLTPYMSGNEEEYLATSTVNEVSIYQPLNFIHKYLSKTRNLVLISDREAAVFEFGSLYRTDIISICNLFVSEVQRYFSIKDIAGILDISIGCALYDGSQPFQSTVDKARRLAKLASVRENTHFLIEGDADRETGKNISVPKEEIVSIIANKTYRCYFTPIMSEEIMLPYYLCQIVPYGTAVGSFPKLIDAADRNGLLVRLLASAFNSIADNFSRYVSQKVIIELPFSRRDRILEAFGEAPLLSSSIIICFSKSELQDFYEAEVNLDKIFDDFRSHHVQLALDFDDESADMPEAVTARFDLFLLTFDDQQPLHGNEKKSSQLISAYSVLSGYNKPMVVCDLSSAADIYLAYELGFRSFVSKAVAPSSSSPYVLDGSWEEKAGLTKKDGKAETPPADVRKSESQA